jgi:hypothetical protein
MNTATTTGTIDWSMRTGGHLDAAERRRLVADLARVQVRSALGRLSLLAHLNPGRKAYVPPAQLVPPDSPLTRAATDVATRVLPSTLLNHSYRTYRFGRALGELEKIDVDAELLFAAALLHDTGLVVAGGRDDFTLTSVRVARDVAEQVGLSTTATETLQTAITMHHSPRVTRAAGPVAYLLSAGAGVDVVGCAAGTFRVPCWPTPSGTTLVRASRGSSVGRGPTRQLEFPAAWRGCCVGTARSRPPSPLPRSTSELTRSGQIELTGERRGGGRSGAGSPSGSRSPWRASPCSACSSRCLTRRSTSLVHRPVQDDVQGVAR